MEATSTTPVAVPPAKSHGSGAGRVFAGIGAGIGGLVLLAGIAIICAHGFARDADGYYSTGDEPLESAGYAITTEDLDLGGDPAGFVRGENGIDFRIGAESGDGQPVFVGLAKTADVESYLGGAEHSELLDFNEDGSSRYAQHSGGRPAGAPAAQSFWLEQAEGTGEQRIEFGTESGHWTVVAMNADGSKDVAISADAGVKVDWLIWVGIGLALVGAVAVGGCAYGLRR